jgi:hypothetical protein
VESSPIKDILYNEISQITESRIQQEISNKRYDKIIGLILDRCIPQISKLSGDSHEVFGTFAESMMHYLLTNALIPSQRKITIKNTQVDLVIPDSRTLGSVPKDTLVLHFVKISSRDSVVEHVEKLRVVQPINENIWLIAKSNLGTPYKTYEIENKSSFVTILNDIDGFLLSKPQSRFRIFKT